MLIKVCGLTIPEQVNQLSDIADYIGFIYYPRSKRYTSLPPKSQGVQRVGVFVNDSIEFISAAIIRDDLDVIQLHGHETPEMADILKQHAIVIKAFGIHDGFDFQQLDKYSNKVDYFLFDTKTPLHGGSGKQFNWDLLKQYDLPTPFLISGGIQPNSIEQVLKFYHPQCVGVDLNSGFETSPGNKNIEAIKQFKNELNKALHSA